MTLARIDSVAPLVGNTINPQRRREELFAHYSIPAFDDGGQPVIEQGAAILSNKTAFPEGAVLFSKLNPRISRVWCVQDVQDAERVCSTEFLPLLPDPTLCDARFLTWMLRSEPFIRSIAGPSAATKSRERVKPADITTASIPLPPLPEQRRIADQLDAAMADIAVARAALARERAELGGFACRMNDDLFASDDPPMPFSEVIADTRNGLYKPDRFYGSGTPILKMFNIDRFANRIVTERLDHIELDDVEREKARLREGDILINRVNSRELVGKCACIGPDQDGHVFESKNVRLTVRRDVADPTYVTLWLNSAGARHQIEDRLKQIAGMATISRPDLDALRIPLPTVIEQRLRVAANDRRRATLADASSALDRQAAALDALGPALLAAAFRGEL